MTSLRSIRAVFDDTHIVVYQAYSPAIADAALAAKRFVSPFSFDRMTWVKPSFAWMMERCGWATKPNQERVLRIRIERSRFEALLARAVPTAFDPALDVSHEAWKARLTTSPVRVQWDPERDLSGATLPIRSLQLGLPARDFADDVVASIEDFTPSVIAWRARREGPVERLYEINQR